MITDRFSPNFPVSCAQGRHGELIIVQGNGVRPARWDGDGAARDAGVDAPDLPLDVSYAFLPENMDAADIPHPVKSAPGPAEVPETVDTRGSISVDPTRNYYVARTDIYRGGNVYYSPPEITYTTSTPIANGRGREAVAQSYLNQSAVSEVRMVDCGKYYPEPPSSNLSDSHGKGAILTATLDAPEVVVTPGNSVDTGVTGYSIISNAPWSDEAGFDLGLITTYQLFPFIEIPIEENGTFVIAGPPFGYWWTVEWSTNPALIGTRQWSPLRGYVRVTISGKVSAGTGAKLRVTGSGWYNQEGARWSSSAASATSITYGQGYTDDDDIVIRLQGNGSVDTTVPGLWGPSPPSKDIVIRAFVGTDPDNPGTTPHALRSIRIDNRGSGYLVAPDIKITSNTGFGAYATCTVKNGQIDTVTLENKGGGYTTPPKVELLSGGAEAFAVARPHLRGKYQCFFRNVDDTSEDRGGPIPSNPSGVTEVDCGEGATSLTWNVPLPEGRGKAVELWRTTSGQAITFYRVATLTTANQFLDDLTDDELRDEEREGYSAIPIILPNGEINAYRFTPPPDDRSVVVRFQDRHWYGVNPAGDSPNAVYFSEVDEPESVPLENELVLQENARDADALQAMIPYGSTLLLMQARHAYSLTFSKQPLLDAQVSPVGYRGCMNQRCWEIHDGVCYIMDQYGIYAMTQQGQIESISDPIENIFKERIDFSTSRWNFLTADPRSQVLRAFVAMREDGSQGFPTAALCYSLDSKTWWIEKYPSEITCGTNARMSNGDFRCVYGGSSGTYLLDEGKSDLGRASIESVTLTNPGAGYKKPPVVAAPGGTGAMLEASIDDEGRVSALWVKFPGYGYEGGDLFISPPDDENHPSPVQAQGTYAVTSADADMPMFPVYQYKTGNHAYATDQDDKRLGGDQDRSVTITYQPLSGQCEVSLRTYYNNSQVPRHNVAYRERGNGFVHGTVDDAARLDMAANTEEYAVDSGVATAMFSGRSLGDIRSTDRHVAVELIGASKSDSPVTFYELNVMGAE